MISTNAKASKMLLLAAFSLGAVGLAGCQQAPHNTDWELLGNSSEMQHRSGLTDINRDNIDELGLVWSVDIPTTAGLVGNPLIKDGIVFQGGPSGFVVANDVRTGEVLWTYEPQFDLTDRHPVAAWGMVYNRGVALSGDNVVIAVDCKLVALNQQTGEVAWEAQSCDPTEAYAITAAPRVAGDLVITGNSCMDTGLTRGYVDAFDSATGEQAWRFYTVPGDPETETDPFYQAAAKTWASDWYERTKGCGSVWDAIVYDEVNDTVVLGVDVAAPIFAAQRGEDAGDELYSGAVVGLDAKTGEYKWHWTVNPNDTTNYTPNGLMIADIPEGDGEGARRSVLVVPKNGFIYQLDAATGEFVQGKDYLPQNWASGLDEDGHAIAAAEIAEEYIVPGGLGGHTWEPMAFNPEDGTMFIPSMWAPMGPLEITMPDGSTGHIMADFMYGDQYGDLVAWDVAAMEPRWRVKNDLPMAGGVLYTDGGLVVQGAADGTLNIYNSDTGEEIWSRNVGGVPRAGPSTVMVDGQQYLIVSLGNASSSAISSIMYNKSGTPETRASATRLMAFAIGGTQALPEPAEPRQVPEPQVARMDAGLASYGWGVFAGNACVECHGSSGRSVGGRVPNLVMTQPNRELLRLTVQEGALASRGMPKFDHLTDEDVDAVYAFLVNEAWAAYEEQQGS